MNPFEFGALILLIGEAVLVVAATIYVIRGRHEQHIHSEERQPYNE